MSRLYSTLALKLQPGQALNPRLASSPLAPTGNASLGKVLVPPPVAKQSQTGTWVVELVVEVVLVVVLVLVVLVVLLVVEVVELVVEVVSQFCGGGH